MHREFQFILFVAGQQHNSMKARKNITDICSRYLKDGTYNLRIVDILEDLEEAENTGIYITPMLIVRSDRPEIRIAGDLSNTATILTKLDI